MHAQDAHTQTHHTQPQTKLSFYGIFSVILVADLIEQVTGGCYGYTEPRDTLVNNLTPLWVSEVVQTHE